MRRSAKFYDFLKRTGDVRLRCSTAHALSIPQDNRQNLTLRRGQRNREEILRLTSGITT